MHAYLRKTISEEINVESDVAHLPFIITPQFNSTLTLVCCTVFDVTIRRAALFLIPISGLTYRHLPICLSPVCLSTMEQMAWAFDHFESAAAHLPLAF